MKKYIFLIITLIITATIYFQTKNHKFVNYDDNLYLAKWVQTGLNKDSITKAFTTSPVANWQPLTFLSHIITVELFGLDAGKHHMINLFIHLLNIALLFFILLKLTNSLWKSGLVALLFAIHPLNVGTVAWIAERKGLLSCFFVFLTILSYLRYTKKLCHCPIRSGNPDATNLDNPRLPACAGNDVLQLNYLWVVVFFVLGMMCKSSIIVLPVLLLLIKHMNTKNRIFTISHLHIFSLFAISALFGIINIFIQKNIMPPIGMVNHPFHIRLSNALLSCVLYIKNLFLPINLTTFYPHPQKFTLWEIIIPVLCLTTITVFAIKYRKQKPYLLFGWLWFVIMLAPVLGLVQIGTAARAMADRYMYLPIIGLLFMIVWGLDDIIKSKKYKILAAMLVIPTLLFISYKQIQTWKDSITLLNHALKVTKNNYLAHTNLGTTLYWRDKKNYKQALKHFEEAIRINPQYAEAFYNLGVLWLGQGHIDKAIGYNLKALAIRPDCSNIYNNLGVALEQQGKIDEAIFNYSKALEINPEYVIAKNNLRVCLLKKNEK